MCGILGLFALGLQGERDSAMQAASVAIWVTQEGQARDKEMELNVSQSPWVDH